MIAVILAAAVVLGAVVLGAVMALVIVARFLDRERGERDAIDPERGPARLP